MATEKTWKYVGPHETVELVGFGLVSKSETFVTDVDLADREDFAPAKRTATTKKNEEG